jgi:steroid 5-alpha reductase family enzyme
MSRRTSLAVLWAAYLWTAAVCWAVSDFLPVESPLVLAAVIDLIATLMIFVFSAIFDNSSVYDPFWSVAPVGLAGFWLVSGWSPEEINWRALAAVALVILWGARLTWNFLSGWGGMQHEDWRYAGFRDTTGRAYWLVSLFGFHLVPTVIVFTACLPVYVSCTRSGPIGVMDLAAIVVTVSGIAIEAVADAQLRAAVRSGGAGTRTFRGGLWKFSRHPNYFGEIVFWWGLVLFALGVGLEYWWTAAGASAVTVLFLLVSLPLIETRMASRRADYGQVVAETSRLVPLPPRNR